MRRRNMYYLTGMPGWRRFGYSPGWIGRSPSGLGPCAQYLLTGQWPTPAMPNAAAERPWGATAASPLDKQQRLQWLERQAELLEQQLQAIRTQLQEMEKQS